MTQSISNNRIPFNNLGWEWRSIKKDIMPDFAQLFDQSQFCLGHAVEQFEKDFSSYIGASYAVGVNSGTSALHLALICAGIKKGDKVLLPTFTFVATLWAVLYVGAIPILCDSEEATGTIDIKDAERRLEPGVKAIIPVHLYGQPANLRAIMAFANKHQLIVIEDACQAHGATYGGQKIGTFGKLGCFSFYAGKNLGAFGEGGIVVTADETLAKRAASLRHHAQSQRYLHDELGFNYRMEGIQGLVLSHKLKHLDNWTNTRRAAAQRYIKGLSHLPIRLPKIVHEDHVFHLFVILTKGRDRLQKWLLENEVETGLHYPVPIHNQPAYKKLFANSETFPIANKYAQQALSLPIYSSITNEQVDKVVGLIDEFFKSIL